MVEKIESRLSQLMNLISEEEYTTFIENDKSVPGPTILTLSVLFI